MRIELGGPSRAWTVADTLTRRLEALRQRFGHRRTWSVAVVGYGAHVGVIWPVTGSLDVIADRPVGRVPVASAGATPMVRGLEHAHELLLPWIERHRNARPPIVVNISDGPATDGDPRQAAAALRALATRTGSCVLANVRLSTGPLRWFPATLDPVGDDVADLFEMSSDAHAWGAGVTGDELSAARRALVLNADASTLDRFLTMTCAALAAPQLAEDLRP